MRTFQEIFKEQEIFDFFRELNPNFLAKGSLFFLFSGCQQIFFRIFTVKQFFFLQFFS